MSKKTSNTSGFGSARTWPTQISRSVMNTTSSTCTGDVVRWKCIARWTARKSSSRRYPLFPRLQTPEETRLLTHPSPLSSCIHVALCDRPPRLPVQDTRPHKPPQAARRVRALRGRHRRHPREGEAAPVPERVLRGVRDAPPGHRAPVHRPPERLLRRRAQVHAPGRRCGQAPRRGQYGGGEQEGKGRQINKRHYYTRKQDKLFFFVNFFYCRFDSGSPRHASRTARTPKNNVRTAVPGKLTRQSAGARRRFPDSCWPIQQKVCFHYVLAVAPSSYSY